MPVSHLRSLAKRNSPWKILGPSRSLHRSIVKVLTIFVTPFVVRPKNNTRIVTKRAHKSISLNITVVYTQGAESLTAPTEIGMATSLLLLQFNTVVALSYIPFAKEKGVFTTLSTIVKKTPQTIAVRTIQTTRFVSYTPCPACIS